MNISKLVETLEAYKEQHGDVEVRGIEGNGKYHPIQGFVGNEHIFYIEFYRTMEGVDE